jgi:hypothetical protein
MKSTEQRLDELEKRVNILEGKQIPKKGNVTIISLNATNRQITAVSELLKDINI